METEMAHPHVIMADFVNKYKQIKPYLEQGNLDGIRFLIGDVGLRWADFEQSHLPSNPGAYARYRMAIQYIGGLFDAKDITKETLQNVVLLADRQVEELELILGEDPHYKSARDTE